MRPLIVAVWLLILSGGVRATAEYRYLAFGDSITAAWSDEIHQGLPPDQRGYPVRLRAKLQAIGINAEIRNFGKGGERTSEGLLRLPTVLDSSFDVLLLMEGTNDVFAGISSETIQFNLGRMDAYATSLGVDTVYGSIIRRIDDPGHAATEAAGIATRELAGTNRRYLVDNWQVLCPTQACFDEHYFHCPAGDPNCRDPVGHPDASGFDIMAEEFFAAITATPPPPAAAPISPAGGTAQVQPTFVWQRVGAANWYRVSIDGSAGNLWERWYQEADVCGLSTCSVRPPLGLSGGAHSWRVQTRNPAGRGPWSRDQGFVVTVPDAVSPLWPDVAIFDTNPLFQWVPSVGAAIYELEIDSVRQGSVSAVDSCGSSRCSWRHSPPLALSEGPHSWRVRAANAVGSGPWSSVVSFAILPCNPRDLSLPAQSIGFEEEFAACRSISAGAGGFVILDSGTVTLHAGDLVALEAGFQVETGGELTVSVEP